MRWASFSSMVIHHASFSTGEILKWHERKDEVALGANPAILVARAYRMGGIFCYGDMIFSASS